MKNFNIFDADSKKVFFISTSHMRVGGLGGLEPPPLPESQKP